MALIYSCISGIFSIQLYRNSTEIRPIDLYWTLLRLSPIRIYFYEIIACPNSEMCVCEQYSEMYVRSIVKCV